EAPDREARIFGMSGYMLGKRPLLRLPRPRLGLGLVVAFVDDNAQPFARAHATLPYALSHDLAAARGRCGRVLLAPGSSYVTHIMPKASAAWLAQSCSGPRSTRRPSSRLA